MLMVSPVILILSILPFAMVITRVTSSVYATPKTLTAVSFATVAVRVSPDSLIVTFSAAIAESLIAVPADTPSSEGASLTSPVRLPSAERLIVPEYTVLGSLSAPSLSLLNFS